VGGVGGMGGMPSIGSMGGMGSDMYMAVVLSPGGGGEHRRRWGRMGDVPLGQLRHYWPGGIECGTDSGGGIIAGTVNARKPGAGRGKWKLVAETHVAEDLQTEFTRPKFHVGRVIELFAETEEVAEASD